MSSYPRSVVCTHRYIAWQINCCERDNSTTQGHYTSNVFFNELFKHMASSKRNISILTNFHPQSQEITKDIVVWHKNLVWMTLLMSARYLLIADIPYSVPVILLRSLLEYHACRLSLSRQWYMSKQVKYIELYWIWFLWKISSNLHIITW